ncbi:transposase [Tenacibaculum maritimum]|uniref:transposase n=1 Tax=Tenacibaculum maritimum TaxID=107401 RepID=UPI0038760F1E
MRKDMKKKALDFMDKVYLRKRAIIESVNHVLKNTCQMEHSKHHSFDSFLGNLIAELTAYSFLESKPSIKILRFLPNLGIG